MIQFRDCVQLWYDDENITKHIISEISSSVNKLAPRHVVFLGSSAGGFAALKYANLSDIIDSHITQQVIANGPQCDVFSGSFMRKEESYREALWKMNGAHPITLEKYWVKNDKNVTIFYGDKCEDDIIAASQIRSISEDAKFIPINSKDHAPAKKKDFIWQILSKFHKI